MKITWEWLAGFFDGEGWVSSPQIQKKTGQMIIQVGLGQRDKEILEEVQKFLRKEGLACSLQEARRGKYPLWKLVITSEPAVKKFCEIMKMKSRMRLKIGQCERALTYIELNKEMKTKTTKEERISLLKQFKPYIDELYHKQTRTKIRKIKG